MQLLSKALLISSATSVSSVLIAQQEHALRPLGETVSSKKVSLASFRPHSAQWYEDKCTAIKLQCENQEEEVERTQAQQEHELEQEYRNENRILESVRDVAEDRKQEVREQKTVVREVRERVEESKTVYERTKTCPAEHRKLEEELEAMEAAPNESEEDIDAECQKKKEILEKEKCVDEYVKAQSTLSRVHTTYTEEKEELSSDADVAKASSQAVDPYARRTEEAKDTLDAERKDGAKKELANIDSQCRNKLKALWRLSEEEVNEVYKRYKEEKDVLSGTKDVYSESRSEVREEKRDVRSAKEEMETAKHNYETYKECPDGLEAAEQELAKLEATPNESEDDIDDECMAKKKVLEKRKCVDKFIEAGGVLSHSVVEHAEEKSELKEEKQEKKVAHTVVKQQSSTVEQYRRQLEEARAAQEALRKCTGPLDEVEQEGPRGAAAGYSTTIALLLGVLSLVVTSA